MQAEQLRRDLVPLLAEKAAQAEQIDLYSLTAHCLSVMVSTTFLEMQQPQVVPLQTQLS